MRSLLKFMIQVNQKLQLIPAVGVLVGKGEVDKMRRPVNNNCRTNGNDDKTEST